MIRQWKRLVAGAATVLLALAMSVGGGAPAVAAETRFLDVPPGTLFFAEMEWMAADGISTGYADGAGRAYRPLQPVNRDAMAAFLYRLAGSPAFTAPATSPFADVPPGTMFYSEITWLASRGISTGWDGPGGTRLFRPLQPINRDAMAAFMYRFAGRPAFDAPRTSPFADVAPGADFYPEITWLASKGISTGWDGPGGTRLYAPVQPINRDAMAAFMYRLFWSPKGPAAFGPGDHRVGTGVAAGTYRSRPSGLCYWERLSGSGGGLEDILANEFTDTASIVSLAGSDAGFRSDAGCGGWYRVEDTYPIRPANGFGNGSYVVGRHLAPGTYRAAGGESCYWERLRGFSGTAEDVTDHDFVEEGHPVVVEIAATDAGFVTQGCGTWGPAGAVEG